MSSFEFWAGVIGVVAVQLAAIYINHQNTKANKPLTSAQAQEALSEAWERLGQEYARLLGHNKSQEDELAALRPLTLKIALQEQMIAQTQKDKDDWKRYSERLIHQLEEREILPIPFRRYPSNGDSQKVKTITKEQVKHVQEHQ